MARPYKRSNKRLQLRRGNGKFRRGTLADIGMSLCKTCEAIFAPNFDDAYDGSFIDPCKMREIREKCPKCRESETD